MGCAPSTTNEQPASQRGFFIARRSWHPGEQLENESPIPMREKTKSLGSLLAWGRAMQSRTELAKVSASSNSEPQMGEKSQMVVGGEKVQVTPRSLENTQMLSTIPNVVQTNKLQIDNLKNSTFVNQYVIIKDVGQGSHGKVKLCLDLEREQLVAVKIVDKTSVKAQKLNTLRRKGRPAHDPLQDLMREIAIMKKLRHPNVVRLLEVIDDPAHGTNKIFMVMEYIEGGPVLRNSSQGYTRLAETLALRYFRDVLKGLEYLHYNKVVHGDLKPENLLLSSEGRLKISDFGSARVVEHNALIQISAGTPAFNAPEMCDPAKPHYDGFKADIWALGVCLYCFVFGKVPFAGSWVELYDAIINQPVTFPKDVRISADLRNLLMLLLEKNPAKRLTCVQILEHPWVTMHGKLPKLLGSQTQQRRIRVTQQEEVGALTALDETHQNLGLMTLSKLIQFEKVTYKQGEFLIRSNEEVQGIFFIEEGECGVINREGSQVDEDFGMEDDDDDDEEDQDVLEDEFNDEQDVIPNILDRALSLHNTASSELVPLGKNFLLQGLNRSQSQHIKIRNMVAKAYESVNSLPNVVDQQDSVYTLGPGCIVGNLSIWGNQVQKEDVYAKTKVIARVAKKDHIESFIKKYPEKEHQIRTIFTKYATMNTKIKTLQDVASYHSHLLEIDEARSRSISWCPEYTSREDSSSRIKTIESKSSFPSQNSQ